MFKRAPIKSLAYLILLCSAFTSTAQTAAKNIEKPASSSTAQPASSGTATTASSGVPQSASPNAAKSIAQSSFSVSGQITDTAAHLKLQNSSISLLNAKDSTLTSFTRSNADGTFAFKNQKTGKYILLITYPGYADYVEHFQLDSLHKQKDIGRLNLVLKATLLKDVLIRGNAAAIKIKGDTTEFNAGSYKIQPNSKVEDLLRQLPGIQIDKDGKITAQGETVNKVLVDGEEFFGDDPTLVTKNIRGDMVDKVQLYDKKSDQATFTGIDDGQKSKTINIKLKEDKKNGYFGKLDAGIATKDFYQAQGMVNIFKGKKKFAAYGTLGNTGKTGLGWEDNSKYGSSGGVEFMEGGGIMITTTGNDELESFDGRFNGEGIPLVRSGGMHYETKWNQDKYSLNTNYKIGSLAVDGVKSVISQNNLPDSAIINNSNQNFHNYMFRHKLDATYQIKLDTTSNLKIMVDGTKRNNETQTDFASTSISENNTLLNDNVRNVSNNGDQTMFNGSVLYTKKLKKKGRTFSLNLSEAANKNDTKGFLNSTSRFYTQNQIDSTQVIDQYKTAATKSNVFSSNLTYSEPLTKSFSLVMNYGFGLSNSTADRRSYNRSQAGDYNLLDTAFSNDFRLNQMTNQVGAMFNYRKNKSVVGFGTKATFLNFEQVDRVSDYKFDRNFINWNPQATYQYKFSSQRSLYLNYNGNSSQPSVEQIQPLRNNTDPLNIVLGNPNLRPSFNNRLNLSYSSYKILSNQSFFASGSYGFSYNAIVRNVVTDAVGKSTYQSINLSNKKPSDFRLYAGFNRKISPLNGNGGLSFSTNGNTYFNYVNNELNETKSNSYNASLNFNSYKEKKYSMYISGGPTYSTNESSLQKQLNDNGWGLNANGSVSVYLPGKLEISTDGNYQYKQATASFSDNFEMFIWNASLAKKFFKSENLKLVASGNDLLNQNKGFRRSAFGNMITQNTYTSIQRYFMLSLTWDFNKMGGSTKK
jgi:hypothetical protein